MPRKRKKEKKKKDRTPFYEEKISDKTKESFLADIQNLTNKLDYYEEKQKNLLERGEHLKARLKSLESNERTLLNAHNKAVANKGAELEKLKEDLIELKENKMSEGLRAEKRLQELKSEIQEVKAKLLADNAQLAAQLKSLQDFKAHQNEIKSKVTRLKSQLEENKLGHEQTIDLMNKLAAELAKQTKEEAIDRVKAAAEELKAETSKEMPDILRRALAENATVESFTAFVKGRSGDVERENQQMRLTVKRNGSLLERLEQRERQLFREIVSAKRDIRLLQEGLNIRLSSSSSSPSPVLPVPLNAGEKPFSQLVDDNEQLKRDIEQTRRERLEGLESEKQVRLETEDLRGRLEEMEVHNESMKVALSKVAGLIRKFLFESPLKSPASSGEIQQEMLVQIHQILKGGPVH